MWKHWRCEYSRNMSKIKMHTMGTHDFYANPNWRKPQVIITAQRFPTIARVKKYISRSIQAQEINTKEKNGSQGTKKQQ